MHYELHVGQERYPAEVSEESAERILVEIGGQSHEVHVIDHGPPVVLSVDGRLFEVGVNGEQLLLEGQPARFVPRVSGGATGGNAASGPSVLHSPMPGRVVRVLCSVGEHVAVGQPLLVLEAMKMENELVAPVDATVTELCVVAGAAIEAGAPLLRLTSGPVVPLAG